MDWFPILFWSGPIGVGAFLAGLGVLFWGLAKVRDVDARAKKNQSPPSLKQDD